MNAIGKYSVPLFNVTELFSGEVHASTVEQKQIEIPVTYLQEKTGHPEILIHGSKLETKPPRGASCCASAGYRCAAEEREWHLTARGRRASDQPAPRCPASTQNQSSWSLKWSEWSWRHSWGSYFIKPPPCCSQGRQTGKSILPLRTAHYKGLPQHSCLSESVPPAGRELLTG